MSCPAKKAPLKDQLQALSGDVEMPKSFYIMTVMMVAVVIGLPLIYRRVWLFIADLITDIRNDIILPSAPQGCRQYGRLGTRNLSKEISKPTSPVHPPNAKFPNHENGELESTLSSDKYGKANLYGRVEALYVHGIKSTHPIEVETAEVSPLGFAYDRLFSFAQRTTSIPDPQTGKVGELWVFLTQRSHPRLQLVKTEIWLPDPSAPDYDEDDEWVQNGGCLVVRFPFTNDVDFSYNGLRTALGLLFCKMRSRSWSAEPLIEFRLPIYPTVVRVEEKNYGIEKMKIWRETPESWNVAPEIPEEVLAKLKYFLGVSNPLTLFRIRPDFERELYKCAPAADKLGYQPKVGFQDGVRTVTLITVRKREPDP
jgi:MOSC N-terminal beta barrel domain